jgi:DNA repair photolyase
VSRPEEPSLFDALEPTAAPRARRGGPVVREVACRSVLNGRGEGGYSFNCYTGCEHGCVYCYARFMQRFHPHEEPWGRFVDVKVNAPQVLARQVRRLPAGPVFTCSACDGWQPVERQYRLTRRCCQILLDAGFSLTILTKSAAVLEDLDVLAGRDVQLGVTITTADERTARLWEPLASPVAARVRVLKEARAAGLVTTAMFGPLLPGVGDTPDALAALFALAAEADVGRIWTDALNPRPLVWPAIRDLLERRRPDLLGLYRRILFNPDERDRYTAALDDRVRRAATAAGVAARLA